MREPIATIRLAPGQVGYYDEYSHIHLTLGNPQTVIFAGTNCAQIRRSIKSGRLQLVSGSLGEDVKPLKLVKTNGGAYKIISNAAEEHKPVGNVSAKEKESKAAPAPKEIIEEIPVKEAPAEEIPAESEKEAEAAPAEEEAPKKKATRKKKAATK